MVLLGLISEDDVISSPSVIVTAPRANQVLYDDDPVSFTTVAVVNPVVDMNSLGDKGWVSGSVAGDYDVGGGKASFTDLEEVTITVTADDGLP